MSHSPTAHRSRRSQLNIQQLSLAPLRTDGTSEPDDSAQTELATAPATITSYIAGRSAPTTPGILSRSSSTARTSRSRRGSQSWTQLAIAPDTLGLEKSKSTTVLVHSQGRTRRRRAGGSGRVAAAASDHGEWLFRAGTAISSEARESKGQGWLTTRESSTSLVAGAGDDDDDDNHNVVSAALAADGLATPPQQQQHSYRNSRPPSRVPSARASRRGSKSGLDLSFYTPAGSWTALHKNGDGTEAYFSGVETSSAVGPDFVNDEDEEIDDESVEQQHEEEIARLARQRGFGLGNLVDQILNSTLFSVKEDGEDTEDDDAEQQHEQPDEETIRRVRAAAERVTAKPYSLRETQDGDDRGDPGEGGWNDAAWLLSVASKVMF